MEAGTTTTTSQTVTSGNPSAQNAGNGNPKAGQEAAAKANQNPKAVQAEGSKGEAGKAAEALTAEDWEEVKIGAAAGKVPKQLAKAIKDLERGVQSKYQEVANTKKQLESQMRRQGEDMARFAKENPEEFLRRTGIDPDQWAEEKLAKKLQRLAMTPEQQRQLELESENKTLKQQNEERQQQDKQHQEQQAFQAAAQQLDQEIAQAWQETQLPGGEEGQYLVKQMAAVMRDSMVLTARGELQRPLTAKEAAAIIKERYEASQPRLFSKMDPEKAIQLIGEENFKRIRDWDVKRVSGSAPDSAAQAASPGYKPASAEKPAKRPQLSEAEWKLWRQTGKLPEKRK